VIWLNFEGLQVFINVAQGLHHSQIQRFQLQVDLPKELVHEVEDPEEVDAQVQEHQDDEEPAELLLHFHIFDEISEQETDPQCDEEGAFINEFYPVQVGGREGADPPEEGQGHQRDVNGQ
jgi:tetrahydromethanopterin S-methyltransferase subunit A